MRRGILLVACLAALAVPAQAHGDSSSALVSSVLEAPEAGSWTGRTPTLVDLDGDGRLELLATHENGHHYAFDLGSGALRLDVGPRTAPSDPLGPFNAARAADLDGDGRMELVAVDRDANVDVWTLAPSGEGGLDPLHRWHRRLDRFHPAPSADAPPALGDLDGDGLLDIVVQTEERGAYALRADGSILWALNQSGGNAEAALADMDGDGDLDAVFSTDNGLTYVADGRTGALLWRYHSRGLGIWPGSAPTRSLVTDLDGDGRPEVVACLRNVENATEETAPGAPRYAGHHFVLLAFDETGLLWKAKPSWGNPMCSAPLMAHDSDGDGAPEIYGLDWNTIGHKPGAWEVLGPAHAFSFDAKGRERWHVGLDATNSKASAALTDWDGDGKQDVVAYGRGRLVALDAQTGRLVGVADLEGWDVKQGPLLLDADAETPARLVLGVRGLSDAFLVLDLPSSQGVSAFPGWEPAPSASGIASPAAPREARGGPEAPAARIDVPSTSAPGSETARRPVPGVSVLALLAALGIAAGGAHVRTRRQRRGPRRGLKP